MRLTTKISNKSLKDPWFYTFNRGGMYYTFQRTILNVVFKFIYLLSMYIYINLLQMIRCYLSKC